MNAPTYDLVIIGGGINGGGIARDAAGRGLSVLLAEMNDLASGTSSASTKLIHGGLRYLEHYEFRLVRESLKEREVLLEMAPHIVQPLRFILPHHRGLRPWLLIRLGLFLYDHLGGRKNLPGSHMINLTRDPAGQPLKAQFTRGFEYSDCWTDDARLVVLNARAAARKGADIRVRTKVQTAVRENDLWRIELEEHDTGHSETVYARALVNAAGPWVSNVSTFHIACNTKASLRLVKGSHIITPKLFDGEHAYIFQHADGRIVFAIPFETDFTLIGTTDVDFQGDPGEAVCSQEEKEYLCTAASAYFNTPIAPQSIVWSYSGVRPLFDNGEKSAQKATRDYVLALECEDDNAPLLNVYGGKITTFRRLAEDALRKLSPWFANAGPPWTRGTHLPGGDFPVEDFDALVRDLQRHCPALDEALARRLAHAYGREAEHLIDGVQKIEDMGRHFGADLYEREVEYLIEHEWARCAEDVLWRRSKLGLRFSLEEAAALAAWFKTR